MRMVESTDHLPDDIATLKAALIETRAKLSGAHAMIEHLQLVIEKMKREMFGPRSERSQRLIDQLELQLEELAAAAGEDETEAQTARVHVQSFTRSAPTRRNFPADFCRAGVSFIPRRPCARAAVAASFPRSARTSLRRSMWCRGNGS
jgi:hypothetical protein